MSSLEGIDDREVTFARSVAGDVAALAAVCPFAQEDDPRAAERELGDFAYAWVLSILQGMGVLREPGEVWEAGQLEQRLGVVARYDRYFAALLRKLAERGLVTVDGPVLTVTERVRGGALDDAGEQVAAFQKRFLERYPACAGLLGFMVRCLARFDEILTGQTDAADVLFQDGDMDVFAGVFRGDVVADYFNRLAAEAVRSAAVQRRARSGGTKVRIVEVGAGTGGTTAAILEALEPLSGAVELCFTDVSPSFLRYARRRFAEKHPWLAYRTLNIEKDLPRQGFDLHSVDVVVAANVLHDTRDIEFTLSQIRGLLRPGGLLVLNEFTAVKDCLFFSGALLHGYWLFEDPDRRLRDTCLLDVPRWSRVLERTGFTLIEPFVLPTQGPAGEHSQSVMLCAAAGDAAAAEPLPEKSGIIGRHVEQDILRLLGEERAAAYSAERPLMEMGLDSIELVELKSSLRGRYGVKLPPAFLFEHATQAKIVRALEPLVPDGRLGGMPAAEAARELPKAAPARPATGPEEIAIVGVACRFPGGAGSPEAFWRLLERGGDGIVQMPSGRWQWPAFVDLEGRHRGIDQGGFLERIDELDARFFRIAPREAELMDPQQRLLLELSWEALEDAGHRPSELAGRKVGVFVGVCQIDYRDVLVAAGGAAEGYAGSGTAFAMLSNRLSYFYDFKGPSLTVDTACSSSLFALRDAVTALRRGECEQALVGAVNLLCSPTISLSYRQAGMLSPTGRCRTFDETADGYVRGEGGAVLLLKPLALALEHGDSIYGLVKGTAVNHGGQATTLTAPKPDAQAEVVEAAWLEAGLAPETAGYVEAHGTGTPLGDPIEVSGLTEAFRRLYRAQGKSWPPAAPSCGLGSVKSNVGHLEGAAGLAGLIKILLSFQHGQIPRTLHVRRLNPEIDLGGSPFSIVERHRAWPRFRDGQGRELPRRAGVSSFGFGGANAHAVLEEHLSPATEAAAEEEPFLIPLSARTQERLLERARRLLDFVERLGPGHAPSQDVLNDLRSLLRRRFDLDEELCTPGLEWAELGWGAVETRLFLAAVEEDLGLRLPARTLIEHPTLQSLAGSIVRQPRGLPGSVSLRDVAFTLQVGREPMEERVAFVVASLEDLAAALRSYVAGEPGRPGCYRGFARPLQERERQDVEAGLAGRDLAKLASLWSQGAEIDWMRLAPAARPRRLHLPTYPFARERYWVSGPRAEPRPWPVPAGEPVPHPLLNQRSSISEQRFSSVLTGDEFFLADHVIQGRRLMPAVAWLEMVRAAVERASGLSPREDESRGRTWLRSVTWVRPLFVGRSPAQVALRLTPAGLDELSFEIYGSSAEAGAGEVFLGQGQAGISPAAAAPVLDVDKVRARCTRAQYAAEDCYRVFAAMGYEYGPAHRGIEALHVGTDEILARLRLPASLAAGGDGFVLHPALADAAVQATIGFALADRRSASDEVQPALPFELQSAEVFRACTPTMWASIRRSDGSREGGEVGTFDIDLCDDAGLLCARFRGWTTRVLKGGLPAGPESEVRESAPRLGEMLLAPAWEVVRGESPDARWQTPPGRTAIVGGTGRQREALQDLDPDAAPLPLDPAGGVEGMRRTIASWGEIGHLVWIVPDHRAGAPDDESILAAQDEGAVFGFRLIKALLAEGYGDRPLAWTVITAGTQAVHAQEPARPAHASVHGLFGSLAKEQPGWSVRLLDLPAPGDWPWRDLAAIPADPHGNARVYRDGRWYRQQLVPCPPVAEAAAEYRPGGVYVILGGAGGVGEAWSEALLRRVPAQLVWIGRRPEDAALRARLDRLAGLGPRPLYIAADATDRQQLAAARETIRRAFGRIDGVIHAAMVVQDHALVNMTEDELRAGLAAKVDVCVRLAQVFAQDPLDFVLFFSSINAFAKWPGQSNYSAGCTFKDAFAQHLATAWPCRVRVINWGYWSVGSLASERYRFLMARKGLGSIELPGAMRALDRLLSGSVPQLAYLMATGPQALEGLRLQDGGEPPPQMPARDLAEGTAGAAELMGQPRDVAAGRLLSLLRRRVAATLDVDETSLDSRSRPFAEALLGEFGMDSLSANSLRNALRRELGADIPVHRIIGEKVQGIVEALYEQLLLQHVSHAPRPEEDEETETFVF